MNPMQPQPQQPKGRHLVQALTRVGDKWEYARLLNGALERTGAAEQFNSALMAMNGLGEEIDAISGGTPAQGTRIMVTIEVYPPESLK